MNYNILKPVLILLLVCSCTRQSTVRISGTYQETGKEKETVTLVYLYDIVEGEFRILDSIPLNGTQFSYSFEATRPQIYALGTDYPSCKLYVKPGDDLSIKMNGNYEIVSGNDKVHDHFRKWNELISETYKKAGFSQDDLNAKIKNVETSVFQLEQLIAAVPDNETYKAYFSKMASAELDGLYLKLWSDPRMMFPEFSKLPKQYKELYQPDKYQDLALSDCYFGSSLAKDYLRFALNYKHNFYAKRNYTDYDSIYIKELKRLGDNEIASKLALEELLNRRLYGEVFYEKEKLYAPLLITDKQKDEVQQYIKEQIEPYTAGVTAPSFTFIDDKGTEISLRDLKGKPVYIDVWATWCAPCKAEIPHLEKVYEAYKEDVQFVSVSVDKNKGAWENFITGSPHSWVQLYGGGEWHKKNKAFFDFYQIAGIPRFILIDKEGKLIMYDAYRPSNDKLIEKLNSIKG
ncbi:TlpA family protein disulfide reductase [Zhouia spongiae]|uniref:TlpA family protein disulfide reductase n=1 Tax=Zhouia spongiae TaxID=2202721 RepID=A0ABY3YL13_9FLAO|nr:TlpA disulfide reductase family protein [Zhouia spongiae]UNY98512.1 TlpA family protein disulfide reductase [Zhouia spongiae]